MFERGIETIISGVIIGVFLLVIEHKSGFFTKTNSDFDLGRPIEKLFRNGRYVVYLLLLVLFMLIWISNFAYFRVISPRFLNTVVIIASSIITLTIIFRRFGGRLPFLRIPIKIFQRFVWVWPVLLIFTTFSTFASPRYLIVVLHDANDDQISEIVIQRIEQHLEQEDYGQIVVRKISCVGPCPLPEKMFRDSRVLLVVSTEIKQNENQVDILPLQLNVSTNCRRDPSPFEKQSDVDSVCVYSVNGNLKVPKNGNLEFPSSSVLIRGLDLLLGCFSQVRKNTGSLFIFETIGVAANGDGG